MLGIGAFFHWSVIMRRLFFYGSFVAVCMWTVTALAPSARADDKNDKKDNQKKDSEKKTDSIKRSQTTKYGTPLRGTIKGVDENSFTFVLQVGKAKKEQEIIIAEDVKVRTTPEPEFDSKGKPKAFKPDPSDPDRKLYPGLPNVKASKDDLRDGQQIVLTLGKAHKKLVATAILILPEKK
jgi:hypothetical protein